MAVLSTLFALTQALNVFGSVVLPLQVRPNSRKVGEFKKGGAMRHAKSKHHHHRIKHHHHRIERHGSSLQPQALSIGSDLGYYVCLNIDPYANDAAGTTPHLSPGGFQQVCNIIADTGSPHLWLMRDPQNMQCCGPKSECYQQSIVGCNQTTCSVSDDLKGIKLPTDTYLTNSSLDNALFCYGSGFARGTWTTGRVLFEGADESKANSMPITQYSIMNYLSTARDFEDSNGVWGLSLGSTGQNGREKNLVQIWHQAGLLDEPSFYFDIQLGSTKMVLGETRPSAKCHDVSKNALQDFWTLDGAWSVNGSAPKDHRFVFDTGSSSIFASVAAHKAIADFTRNLLGLQDPAWDLFFGMG